ncbi:hypothetical protein WJX84_000416 [Apatococcus fuscideae]|uniref:Uncharacterized protein n=1 Tax=Apatococcus fuscideae TaxID=2026836 RepID=A0AAW1T217_9CHLO
MEKRHGEAHATASLGHGSRDLRNQWSVRCVVIGERGGRPGVKQETTAAALGGHANVSDRKLWHTASFDARHRRLA